MSLQCRFNKKILTAEKKLTNVDTEACPDGKDLEVSTTNLVLYLVLVHLNVSINAPATHVFPVSGSQTSRK